ncbi:phosphoribosylformylglycinamidine synthase subunit PurL [Terracoccus luteus]|uniref:Phosphoribosylformylglycinamidine synthase subunit PurL n=1 Tax=Terracoccus luteus TaxID=53356 RepID=A0A839PWF3_9MICO|nr:phosphoribosylformylglycinamidine synthase subunit PurL [Terracoccus luteus]MBB2988410.1 phosphoribosylformylglycinamidine synthase [Terracoccus luteus]MCP2174063.1 phosphoribosylformylglycinamidine synthase [Terracoccus luteus]
MTVTTDPTTHDGAPDPAEPTVDTVDTVENAAATPDLEQPWAELGLKGDEYANIREIIGRRPTIAELAMYSVMWSEHCSYKSSKIHFTLWGENTTDEMREKLLVGIGENAGVVDIGDGWAVTFKVESHNHPSYVEPYQGAATGVGGIIRDIMSMGARPIAVMDPLRFGNLHHPDTQRVLPGVVAGVGGYGNCIGLPNIGGEVVFDDCYQGNPLVNALCVGAMRIEDIHLAKASGAGNKVILFGARTGGDGIGGVSVLASETFEAGGPAKRPAVQVGDPFAEKVLIECCLDLYAAHVVDGIQDLGGAGLSCATSELASNGDGGMKVELDLVPLRDASLQPHEILMSESQERMMAVVEPGKLAEFMEITARWDVEATVIGEVTDGDHLVITWHGETIVDVPPRSVAHEGPTYDRPLARPDYLDALNADGPESLARPTTGDEIRAQLLTLLGSPNLCSKAWVTDQYDRYVLGNTALAQPDDAGVVRVDEETGRGVAIATDCNSRFAKLDPYTGAQLALAEAYRNVATSGAAPLAVTDCLNFGSPEDPGVMWQFREAIRGIAEGCRDLGIPVTGGNVSFYNQTGDVAIHPTPVIGVLGVLEDVSKRTGSGFRESGSAVYLLGETRDELGGSEWAHVVHKHLGGLPPRVDLMAEQALAKALATAVDAGVLESAHDLSDGGLAIALAEASLRHGVGVTVDGLDRVGEGLDAFTALFSESTARVLVSVAADRAAEFETAVTGIPAVRIGTTGGRNVEVTSQFTVSLAELRVAHEFTLPAVFGG